MFKMVEIEKRGITSLLFFSSLSHALISIQSSLYMISVWDFTFTSMPQCFISFFFQRLSDQAYFITKELLSTERTFRKDLKVITFVSIKTVSPKILKESQKPDAQYAISRKCHWYLSKGQCQKTRDTMVSNFEFLVPFSFSNSTLTKIILSLFL